LEAGPLKIDPGHGQHLARLVDAERALDPRRQDFEHTAGTGPDSQQIAGVGRRDDFDKRCFDLAFVDVERTDAVPLGGIFAEIGARNVRALAFARTQSLKIQSDRGIGITARRDELSRQRAYRARLAQAIEDPAAFAEAVEETGSAQELQVTRYSRLALPQNLSKLAHSELAAGTWEIEPQPSRLRHRAQ